MKKFISLLMLSILSGCANFSSQFDHSIFELKLLKPINLSAGISYAYIVTPGVIVKRNSIGTRQLYCKISVPRSRQSDAMQIQPDTFLIKNIYRRSDVVKNEITTPMLLASREEFTGYRSRRSREVSSEDLELHFQLYSENQPQVKALTCIRFADPWFENFPTLSESRRVISGLAEIIITPKSQD